VFLRLADLLVGLSGVTDLGMGLEVGDAARACLVSTRLAQESGCSDEAVRDVFYTSLLMHVGCTAYSHEVSQYVGDEQSVKRAGVFSNPDSPVDLLTGFLPRITREAPPGQRLRTLRNAVLSSRAITDGFSLANCQVGRLVAGRLELPDPVADALLDVFEWWNGKGRPRKLQGEAIAPATRLAQVGGCAAAYAGAAGPDAAVAAIRSRAGGLLDPEAAARMCTLAPSLLADLTTIDVRAALLELEPQPHLLVPEPRLDAVLAAFGDAVDLKSPIFHGHSAAVGELADRAATHLGLTATEVSTARRAGLVCDVGRAAVADGIWERPGTFTQDDWVQVRLHPYWTEQVVASSPLLAEVGGIAGAHHERLDGSGYYRRAAASSLPATARVVAAADAYVTSLEPRPHRAALGADEAADRLLATATAGGLDPEVVDAVLAAAGNQRRSAHPPAPGGLTPRQVEVLRLLANGMSNKEIGARLGISARTAEHHVQDIYTRLGVSSRAPAALFAMEHRLLGPADGTASAPPPAQSSRRPS
jgi:HD-GYP domain-containing protein (c-di-GMP phosphodiesterase class II)